MKRIITEETIERIRMLLKAGKTGLDISDQTGVSISTICRIRKELEREGFDIWHVGGAVSRYI